MAHKALQCDEVAVALPDEAVREAVSQLVGGEEPHTRSLANPPRESPERLLRRGLLRILPTPHALALVDPDLNFNREDMVGGLRSKLVEDIRVDRQPVPVVPLATDTHTPAHEVDVFPAAGEYFRAPQTDALHEQNWRPLVPDRCRSNLPELLEARPVDVRLTLRRLFRDGSMSTRSSASAHEKNEWNAEITFERVDALRFCHRRRQCRRSAVVSASSETSG